MSNLSSISVDDLANLYLAPSTTPRRSILPPVLPTQADAPRQEAQQPNDAGARDPAQGRTWGELGSDLWTGLQRGVQGIASGINNLGDLASGGLLSYGMGHLYSAATGTDERPTMQEIGQRVSQNLSAQESPYLQAQRQQLQADMASAGQQGGITGGLEKAWAAAKGVATNPALLGQMAVEQIPILATMGTGSLAAAGRAGEAARLAGGTPAMIRQAAEQAAIRANIGLSGGLGAGYSSQQAAEEVLNAPAEELAKSPNYQALVQSGLSDRQARQQLAQQAMVPAAAIAGPVSALTARITAPMETAAFMGKLPKGFGPVAAAGVREMTEEIPQESSEQIGQNVGSRSVGLNRDIMAGVPEAAGQAGVAGLLMGAGLSGVNVARHGGGDTASTESTAPEFSPPETAPGAATPTEPQSAELSAPPAGLNEPPPDTGPVSRAANQVIPRSAPPPLAAGRNAPASDPYADWIAQQSQQDTQPNVQQIPETIPRQTDAGNPRPEVREGSRVGSPVEPVTDQNPASPQPEVARVPQSQEALPAEAATVRTLAARPEVQALGDRIAVVGRQSELRPELQPKDGEPVKAVIDGNRIVLVGEHWSPEDVANLDGVLQHEAGVHLARDSGFYDPKVQAAGKVLRAVGIKSLAGEASWADVTRQLESLRRNGNESVAKAFAMAEQAGTSPELMSEEALGYLAELNPKHSLVRRLVATVKAALYRMGVNVKLDDAALVALARSGLNRVKTEQRLPAAPQEPRYSRLIRWTDNQSPEVRSMAEKIGAEPKPWTERLAEMRGTLPTRIRQGTIDQFARLLDLDRARFGRDVIDTDTALSSWVAAKMSKSPEGALEGAFLHGRLKWDDGALNVQETKQGLAKALEPIASAGELNRFWQWIIAHRSNRLMSEGRERLFTPQEIAAGIRLNEGKMQGGRVRNDVYRKAFARYVEIQKSVLDVAEQAGLFNAAQRAQWEHDFYLPYYRVIDNEGELRGPSNGGGKLIRQKAFEKLKGGTEKLGDPLQNILRNWHHLIDASLKNRAASLALDTAENLGVAQHVTAAQADKNSVWVMRNGDKEHYRIDDPLTLEALSALNAPMMSSAAVKALAGFKRALTIGVTISPAFKARNLLRDSVAAFAISGLSPNVFKVNPIKGMMLAREGSATQAALLAGGGTFRFGTMMEGDPAAAARRISGWKPDTVLNSSQQIKGFYQALKSGLDAWNRLGDQMETANRASIYEQMRSEGKTHLQASLAARDLMDFSQSGAWPAVRFLTTITPFLNARLQGMDVLYRKGFNPLSRTVTGKASSGERKAALRFAATIATVSLASTLLYLAYRDDEDFQKREQWDRDNYWWFKLGEEAYRIPKPFEVGALGTIAERIAEQIVDQSVDGKLFADRLKFMLTQTFAMDMPQAFKPAFELATNRSQFTGRPIEPMGMENLSPELRARYNTSAAAIAASQAGLGKVGLSPLQIEHLVRGYFGWIGAQALLAGDFAARPAMGLPERPMKQSDVPLVGDLLQSFKPDSRGSRYVTEFYEQAKEVRQVMADARLLVKLGDTEALDRLKQDKSKEIGQSASVEAVVRMFSAFGEMERMIANSRTLSGMEKQRQIDAIEKRKSDVAREVGRRLR